MASSLETLSTWATLASSRPSLKTSQSYKLPPSQPSWGCLLQFPQRAGARFNRSLRSVKEANSSTTATGFGPDAKKKPGPQKKGKKAQGDTKAGAPEVKADDDLGPDPFWGNVEVRTVCDRLAKVFLEDKTEPAEWKKLLVFSQEWGNIRARFYTRLKQRAQEAEDKDDPEEALRLHKLQRRLRQVEEEMEAQDKLLEELEACSDLESFIQRRRGEFSAEFFTHIATRADASYDKPERRDELAALASKLFIAVQTHDKVSQDQEAMGVAQEKFLEILDSADMATVDRKIDELAAKGGLDPALLLMMSKAYVKARDTDLARDEVKDIMAHMYFKAKESMQRYLPKEVRILRHILSLDDPRERYAALGDAFEPGPELEGDKDDLLYTTQDRLLTVIESVLDAYHSNAKDGTMVKEAAALMKPAVIDRMQDLKETIQRDFR